MLLSGKTGIVFGVANKRSLAWAIARRAAEQGARIALTYQGERLEENARELAATLTDALVLPCDVAKDDDIVKVFERIKEEFGTLDFVVHGVAFALREELEGEFVNTSREGYRIAQDVSAYSLTAIARGAAPLMEGRNGCILGRRTGDTRLQRDGRGESCPRYERQVSGLGPRPARHTGERALGRSHQDSRVGGHSGVLEDT